MTRIYFTTLLSLGLVVCTAAATDPLEFSEGDFAPGSYTVDLVEGGAGGTSTLTLVADGGAPGAYLAVKHDLPAGPPPGEWCAHWIWTFVWIDGATVEPGDVGGIGRIDHALSCVSITSENTVPVQSQRLALRQDGRIYLNADSVVTPETEDWVEIAADGLRADDFVQVISVPPCDFTIDEHPDFSRGGSPIELGFARGNSTSAGGNDDPTSITVGADTWSATVHVCPADIDCSGVVDLADLLAVLIAWGECEGCPEDIDGSGAVALVDLIAVLSSWGPCTP